MNNSTNSIQKVQPHEYLPSNFFHHLQRQSLVIVSFKNLQQIYSQNLEHHAKMVTIGSFVKERIEQV